MIEQKENESNYFAYISEVSLYTDETRELAAPTSHLY